MISLDNIDWMNRLQKEQEYTEHYKELLSEYQAEMVYICRELGIDPDVQMIDPTYYTDLIIEAIDNLKQNLRFK